MRLIWGPLSPLGLALALLVFGVDQAHKWWMLNIYDIGARGRVSFTRAMTQRHVIAQKAHPAQLVDAAPCLVVQVDVVMNAKTELPRHAPLAGYALGICGLRTERGGDEHLVWVGGSTNRRRLERGRQNRHDACSRIALCVP
jgi:hypothetical protein